MGKRLLLIISALVLVVDISAQEPVPLQYQEISTSQLVGKVWERVSPRSEHETVTMSFTQTAFTDSAYYSLLEKSSLRNLPYYVTNEQPTDTTFRHEYVGQERTGRYIVKFYPKANDFDYFTVVSLTDDELILFHKARDGQIPRLDSYIKYRRK